LLTLSLANVEPQTPTASALSRWSLHIEPALCTLERVVDEPFSSVAIRTMPGSDVYEFMIANADVKSIASIRPASLRFDPTEDGVNGYAASAKLPNGLPIVSMRGLPPVVIDQLAKADSVSVVAGSEIKGSAQTPKAAAAVSALRKCEAEQLIEWGADERQFASGGKVPVGLKQRDEWISNDDLMMIARESKRPNIDDGFRVAITSEGVIEDCRALTAATESDLERAACAAVTGKRLFTPALDSGGRPVRGAATFRVVLFRRPA
jgi:hypothetical protein